MHRNHSEVVFFQGRGRASLRRGAVLGLSLLLVSQPASACLEDPIRGISSSQPLVSASGLPDAPLPAAAELTITILEGEGALNNIRQRTAREPIVQVEDKNHKPVAGALVLFSIHNGSGGAGAVVNGLTSLSVKTGVDGKAQLHGLKPNNVEGDFTISVTATADAMTASIVIHQSNSLKGASSQNQSGAQTSVLKPSQSWFVRATWIGGIAAVGVIVGLVATRDHGGAQITAGQPVVGAP